MEEICPTAFRDKLIEIGVSEDLARMLGWRAFFESRKKDNIKENESCGCSSILDESKIDAGITKAQEIYANLLLKYRRKEFSKVKENKKLTTKARKKLSSKSFVFPKERKYPIHDRSHAANALARVSQFGTPSEKAKVRAAVCRKYPDLASCKKHKENELIENGDWGPKTEECILSMKKTGKPLSQIIAICRSKFKDA